MEHADLGRSNQFEQRRDKDGTSEEEEAGTEQWNPIVAELKKEINSIKAQIADWKSRVYKTNNHTYHNRDEEAVTTYGRINENRRKKAINRLNSYLKTETEKLEKVTNHMEHYSF